MFLSLTSADTSQDVRQDIVKYLTQNAAGIDASVNLPDQLLFSGALNVGIIEEIASMMKYGGFNISPDSQKVNALHKKIADADKPVDTIVSFFAFDEREIPIFCSLFMSVCEALKQGKVDKFDILEKDRDALRRKMAVVYGSAPLEECMMQLANCLKGKSN